MAQAQSPPGNLRQKRILTIDDSPTVRVLLRHLLSSWGACVEAASTGEEGLALCAAGQPYDLILLDLHLPDADGITVLEQIRATNDTAAIVMLTGQGGIHSAMQAVQKGADGYLEKHSLADGSDHREFAYALEQALERRAGLVAQKQLHELKADFYSMVTHDLRNPAGGIQTALSMLADEGFDSLNPSQQELLQVAQQLAEKLLKLISDYLDFAKIDAGFLKPNVSEVELGHLVKSGVQFTEAQAKAKKQSLALHLPDRPLLALVDPELFSQVLDNLISNAIKYTPEGGRISVELAAADGQAILRVSDNGYGIPANQLPALFSRYHRLPGASSVGIKGSGLGLLIVKEIVQAHGGTVAAASDGVPGHGSTFTVKIPLNNPAKESVARAT